MARKFSYDDELFIQEIYDAFGKDEFTVREYCAGTSHNPRRIGARLQGIYNRGGVDKIRRVRTGNNEAAWIYRISEMGLKVVK